MTKAEQLANRGLKETAMNTYIIYRHGSNTANQSMCEHLPIAIVNAKSSASAIFGVEDSELFTIYANQHLSALRIEDFKGTEDELMGIYEEVEERQRMAQASQDWAESMIEAYDNQPD